MRSLKTHRSEATRRQILDVAMECFRRQGFKQTTMRDVAREASVALGSTYYYFRSKEEMVMAFYYGSLESQWDLLPRVLSESTILEERVKRFTVYRMEQLAPYRHLLGILVQVASDPASPMSPFSPEHRSIHEKSIAIFQRLVEGTRASVPRELKGHLPRLLWLFHLGILIHWIYDRSPEQEKTYRALDKGLGLIGKAMGFIRLPFVGATIRPFLEALGPLKAQ